MHLCAGLYRLVLNLQDDFMLIFTTCVIVGAIVITLALAASASPNKVAGSPDLAGDDEHVRPLNMAPKPFVTGHPGVADESKPVVSAAGFQ